MLQVYTLINITKKNCYWNLDAHLLYWLSPSMVGAFVTVTLIQSQRRFLIWKIKSLLLVYFCYLVLDENLKHQMDLYKYSVLYFPYIEPQLFEICYNTKIVFYMLIFISLLYALFLVYGWVSQYSKSRW